MLTKNTTLKICRTHFRKLTLQQSASLDFLGLIFFFFPNSALPSFFFSSAIFGARNSSFNSFCFHLCLFMIVLKKKHKNLVNTVGDKGLIVLGTMYVILTKAFNAGLVSWIFKVSYIFKPSRTM